MAKTKLGTGNDVIELAQRSEELEFFIEWLTMPTKERPAEIRSQAKLAVHLGVSEQTLRNWKRDPRVQSKVAQIRSSRLRIEDLPDVYATLLQQATDPQNPRSVSAAKLLIEEASSILEEAVNVELSEMTNSQLRQVAADLYDELDDREHGATETA